MNTITQTMRFRQALIQYSLKYGVTKAAIRYKVNRQYVYRWQQRYDGTLQSLADKKLFCVAYIILYFAMKLVNDI